ncbi:MAG: hypothetical protein Q4A82_00020 [Corynebacterium sp.]|nr:hypothetical protein [Corynebacterium sp.]
MADGVCGLILSTFAFLAYVLAISFIVFVPCKALMLLLANMDGENWKKALMSVSKKLLRKYGTENPKS